MQDATPGTGPRETCGVPPLARRASHQAKVDVDEKGTEAVVIRDVKTGAMLFMGRVMDPLARS
jgi:serine protease inhibitor